MTDASPSGPLPHLAPEDAEAGRLADIDELMYSCGVDILHPGGIEKTDEMARTCKIEKGKKILDVGCGKGVTACYLAQKYECEVIGVDSSERMIKYANEKAEKEGLAIRVSFRTMDACNLLFEDGIFDIVLAECSTTLMDKQRAFSEFIRVTKPGGYIGDLEMTWQKPPPKELVDKAHDIWAGFTTMPLEEWQRFYERLGMVDVKAVDFSEAIPDMERMIKKEMGIKGTIKMSCRLLFRSDLRRAMMASSELFRDYAEYIGYGYIVGKKR